MSNKKEVIILKIENIKQSIILVSKTIETKSIYSENLQSQQVGFTKPTIKILTSSDTFSQTAS